MPIGPRRPTPRMLQENFLAGLDGIVDKRYNNPIKLLRGQEACPFGNLGWQTRKSCRPPAQIFGNLVEQKGGHSASLARRIGVGDVARRVGLEWPCQILTQVHTP
jgi:hypothetical protein